MNLLLKREEQLKNYRRTLKLKYKSVTSKTPLHGVKSTNSQVDSNNYLSFLKRNKLTELKLNNKCLAITKEQV